MHLSREGRRRQRWLSRLRPPGPLELEPACQQGVAQGCNHAREYWYWSWQHQPLVRNTGLYYGSHMADLGSTATTTTPAERAARHRHGMAAKLDLVLSEISALRRKVDGLERCPIASVVAERRAADQAIASALRRGS